ncbi:MAG TPA: hypothetical protein DEQ38_09850 [Elusimicrobia bacterium]|nr:MAG: hypothetical protein A2089_03995 [Elusimicrobia bacterium GWD2_63_28]HCC48400.1 hypothetical protein [Elusimicrobiota bacterium]
MRTRAYTIAIAAAALLAAGLLAPARAEDPGTTAANFLKIPVAAVPSGMGEAYTAMVGPDSILYNPAGLGLLSYSSFSGSHNQYIDGITQEYLALAWRFPFATVAAAYSSLSSGDIDAYDENDMPVGKTSTSHQLTVFSVAQSWPRFKKDAGKLDPMLITPPWTKIPLVADYRPKSYRLAAGASVKKISEKLAGESSAAYAFDAGLTLILPRHFHVGASALNYGGSQKFLEASSKLPSSLRFGIAKDFHTVNDVMVFTVASDMVKYSDRDYQSATGLEVDVMKMFQLRLGYKTQKDSGSRVCGGFGMNFDRLSDKNSVMMGARVDYSYLDYGSLGATHRLGVQLIW